MIDYRNLIRSDMIVLVYRIRAHTMDLHVTASRSVLCSARYIRMMTE